MRVARLVILFFLTLLIVSFQNCQGTQTSTLNTLSDSSPNKRTPSGSSSTSESSTGISVGSARTATRSTTTTASGSSLTSGTTSSATNTGSTSTTSTGTCLGCTTSTTNTGSVVPGTSTTNYVLEIVEQPLSKTIPEGYEFTVGVTVRGGKTPYSFKWYRNNQLLDPLWGDTHYESYTTTLDRIYKEGDYHVVVTDATGVSKISSKAVIRMTSKVCPAGVYWFPVTTQTSYPDIMTWFGDLFIYKQTKYFVSEQNPTISYMVSQKRYVLKDLGFRYFNLKSNVSNSLEFAISCGTDVPTVHTAACSVDAPHKCSYADLESTNSTRYYQGGIEFKCRNGYLEFLRNSCQLITPPPPPESP